MIKIFKTHKKIYFIIQYKTICIYIYSLLSLIKIILKLFLKMNCLLKKMKKIGETNNVGN